MKKFIFTLLLFIILSPLQANAANKFFPLIGLTGTGTGAGNSALDGIAVAGISDGDFAYGYSVTTYYAYIYDASSAAAESSPSVIVPNDNVSGTGAWIQINVGTGTIDSSGTPVANDFARFADVDTIEGRSYSEARTDLGLVIGADVQAWDFLLDDISDLVDPNADRITFWDDTAGIIDWLILGTGLTITDKTISATGATATLFNAIGSANGAASLALGAYQHQWTLGTAGALRIGTATDYFEFVESAGDYIFRIVDGGSDGNIYMEFDLLLANEDVAPSVTGQFKWDNAVTGLTRGALSLYDGVGVRYLVDLDTLPSDDDYVVSYDAVADKFYMKADASGSPGAYESNTEADFYGTILNPQGVYDNDATNHALSFAVNVPAAFTITAIYISCDADPTTEPTLTFQHKAAGVGYGTPTTIEAVTTTAGVASITSGIDDATIPANTKLFITLSDPDDALNEITWQIKGDWD